MRWKLYATFFLILFSCNENRTDEYHLQTGLSEYSKKRRINENFIENYSIQSIAFFNKGSENEQLVLKLNDDIPEEIVEKYALGIHAFSKELQEDNVKGFLIWDRRPLLDKVENNNYISVNVKTRIKVFDSINFFLYQREGYEHVIGNMIRLRNVKL